MFQTKTSNKEKCHASLKIKCKIINSDAQIDDIIISYHAVLKNTSLYGINQQHTL